MAQKTYLISLNTEKDAALIAAIEGQNDDRPKMYHFRKALEAYFLPDDSGQTITFSEKVERPGVKK